MRYSFLPEHVVLLESSCFSAHAAKHCQLFDVIMWPSTSISIYEKVARDESSESSASISPGLEELSLRPGNRSTSPPQGSDRNPKVWLLVGFAATTILLVIDLVLRSQALSRQVRYVETPVPECAKPTSIVSHQTNIMKFLSS